MGGKEKRSQSQRWGRAPSKLACHPRCFRADTRNSGRPEIMINVVCLGTRDKVPGTGVLVRVQVPASL